MDAALEYWRSGRGLDNLTPAGTTWPEGESFPWLLSGLCQGEVVAEIGCGAGRLASASRPDAYVGVDVCAEAVRLAREKHPAHSFRTIAPQDEYPLGTCALLHTVLLHVPDEQLGAMLERLAAYPRVIVGEILGRKWRRPGNPPVFNRELEDYVEAFGAVGLHLFGEHRVPYPRYKDTHLTLMDWRGGQKL